MNSVLRIDNRKEYWGNELKGPLPGLPIYMDAPMHNESGEHVSKTLLLDIDDIKARQLGLIYNMDTVMLACYLVLLHRLSNESDLMVGIMGPEGELLPLRVACSSQETIKQLITGIIDKLFLSFENKVPLARLEEITGEPPIIRTVYGENKSCGYSVLNWLVRKERGYWRLHVSYDRHLFKEKTIDQYAAGFKRIVDAALNNIQTAIGSIDMVTQEDSAAYAALNDTYRELPQELTIVERFASIVRSFPDRTALSSEYRLLTYGELDRQSDRVAAMLRHNGVKKGDLIAIFMERSIETVISMLGVLKAGGAYVPLDPEHPEERNAYIIEDTGSKLVITQSVYTEKVSALIGNGMDGGGERILPIDQDGLLERYSEAQPTVPVGPDDLAYVIYTSGSTGKPKGALIAHKGVVNLALAIREGLDLNEEDILLQYSTFSFDASVYDLFGSMLNGSRLHLLGNDQRFSIDSFTEAVESVQATRISILPTVFFNQLATYLTVEDAPKFSRIKSLVVGGEALAGETVRQFQKKLGCGILIVNAYGPTECTVASTSLIIDNAVPEHVATMNIGTPLSNYELYIVNSFDRLCPVNVTGELLISSVGVGKGYLNQPDKTREAFIPDPIRPDSGKIFYRSGDMVRLLANGQVEYMGRKDSQVKIRGYRIEIGEIEDNLVKFEAVKDAAVIVRTEENGTKSLAAFYTTVEGRAVSRAELVDFLSKKVPAYMVPEHFQWLETMPVTPTGKLDRRALASVELVHDVEKRMDYAAPRNHLENEICKVWEKVLHRSDIGITDNFFEIGGHSIKILEILVTLKPVYPQLKINDFFQYPTVEQLAARISLAQNEETAAAGDDWANKPPIDLLEHPVRFDSLLDSRIYTQKHILLTGSTGYLGSHILYELLKRPESTVYCLVRPLAGYSDPFDRLAGVMARYYGEGMKELLQKRVVVIQGDLEQEGLGLSPADRQLLDERLDSIIHCGAEVKHFGDAEYFTRVNVKSTERLLALAKGKECIRRFHFISTLGIPEELALGGRWDDFISSTGYEANVSVENVYTQSKLEAEMLAVKACEVEGVPVTVYRVGNLSCRSDSGMFQQNIDNNAFYRMLKAMILLGAAPKAKCYVDLTPVDYAGEAIVSLALHQGSAGRMFHICNPVQLAYEEMVSYFQAYGYDITFMDLKEYEAWLLDAGSPKCPEGLQLAMAQLEGDGAKHSNYRFSCTYTNQYLAESHVYCKVPDREFFNKLIDYAIRIGYFSKPGITITS